MTIRMQGSTSDGYLFSAVLQGISAVLLLFTCISTPIMNSMKIYTLSAVVNGGMRFVDVGLWGYCIQPLRMIGYNAFTLDVSVLDGCVPSRLGYSLGADVEDALRAPGLNGLHPKGQTSLFVLFPIATGLTAIACLIMTGIKLMSRTRSMQIPVSSRGLLGLFIYNFIVSFVVLFALIVEVSVLVMASSRVENIRKNSLGLKFKRENTIWLVVVAFVCHIIDLVVLWSLRKRRIDEERGEEAAKAARTSKPKFMKQVKWKKNKKAASEEDLEEGKEADETAAPPPSYGGLDGYIVETEGKTKDKKDAAKVDVDESVEANEGQARFNAAYDLDGYAESGPTKSRA